MKRHYLILFLILVPCVLSAQKNINLVAHFPYNETISDIWGYTDMQGTEYALVGTYTGTSIVSLANPQQPEELFFIPGDSSIWRDIKTYQNYAYVTNEEGGGLLIIDLNLLPNSIYFEYFTADTFELSTAHNIYIDEFGYAFLLGSNIKNQGAFILDLNTTDKFKPNYAGIYDVAYCHDAYVKDNIMWSAEVFDGNFSVIDISNKNAPIVLARQQTSTRFTHQCWLSDDGNYLITNDEKPGAYIDIYDVSDLNNIQLLDKYRTKPNSNTIPHNVFFVNNDYFFTSYYKNGVTLTDATKKDNIVEVGNYDTSPFPAADGFNGCWGVYPYLPSGLILASDIEEGLFVLQPNYTRACYLEGTITDALNQVPLKNMQVEIIGTDFIKQSHLDGSYRIGVADSDYYDIRISSENCKTVIVSGILLSPGQVEILNIETFCDNISNIASFDKQKKPYYIENPIQEKLIFQNNTNEKLIKLEVFNNNGQSMKEILINDFISYVEIINNWKSGVYFIKIHYSNAIFEEKLIKK